MSGVYDPIRLVDADAGDRIQVRIVMAHLKPRERSVIERLFFEDMKLAEVAAEEKVSTSRIQQIRDKALKRFRKTYLALFTEA